MVQTCTMSWILFLTWTVTIFREHQHITLWPLEFGFHVLDVNIMSIHKDKSEYKVGCSECHDVTTCHFYT
jgi:hypothetical protein